MTKDASPDWYKLDNAAKIFPAVDSPSVTTMFRISATLTEPVSPAILQRAHDELASRFPYFHVKLSSGLFWHFLQRVDDTGVVAEEHEPPCRTINARNRGSLLFRILYFGRKLSVEFSHILTDGAGALAYLRALVAQYLRHKGIEPLTASDLMLPEQSIDHEEYEDSYQRFYDPLVPLPPDQERAYQLPFPVKNPHSVRITTGITPVAPVLELARSSGVSLTEYLSALYLFILHEHLESFPDVIRWRCLRPIRLVVPVNLRKLFPSRTMRNFILHITPGIDPRLGRFSFNEVLAQVHHYMRGELNEKLLKQQITRNMRGETHPLIRVTPIFLKIPIERMLYSKYGNSIASGVLSNLGPVNMPHPLDEKVERFEFITVPNPDTKLSVGIISHGDRLYITFGSLIAVREVERRFFSTLRMLDVPVKIETN